MELRDLVEQFGRVVRLCPYQLSVGISKSYHEMGISSLKEGSRPYGFSDPGRRRPESPIEKWGKMRMRGSWPMP